MDSPAFIDIGTLIHFPEARYGRPCLAGTGMYVYRVIDYHKMGWTPEYMAEQLPHISVEHFYAALAFYYLNKQACDDYIAHRDAEAERLYQEHRARNQVAAS